MVCLYTSRMAEFRPMKNSEKLLKFWESRSRNVKKEELVFYIDELSIPPIIGMAKLEPIHKYTAYFRGGG